MPRSSNDLNTEPCEHCGVTVCYKSDIARHNQLHNEQGETFKCTYEGCTYESLQKSNLKTHLNQHTGEKPYACPDCDFCTSDPGCLIRHRKRFHNYVTKRRSKRAQPAPGTKQSRRHAPYLKPALSLSPSPDPFDARNEAPCKATKADGSIAYTWSKTEDPSPSPMEEVSEPFGPFTPALFGLWPTLDPCVEVYNKVDFSMNLFSLPSSQDSWPSFDVLPSWSNAAQSQHYPTPEFYPSSASPTPSSSSSSLDSESLFSYEWTSSSLSPSPDAFLDPYVSEEELTNFF
ncbi:hypothetical protein H0H92_014287 [Tricholoma furcatifolium]|nr:hypothetical protein H0H92_014287 [Tricholoma furcatifolium]